MLARFADSLCNDSAQWQAYAELEGPEAAQPPGDYAGGTTGPSGALSLTGLTDLPAPTPRHATPRHATPVVTCKPGGTHLPLLSPPAGAPATAGLSEFERLLLLRCLRPDRVTLGVARFVTHSMGERFVQPPVLDYK